jgi:chromosomal replication initiation ATPase DnaA
MRTLKDLLAAYKDPDQAAAILAGDAEESDDGLCRTCGGARFVRYAVPPGDERFGKLVPCPHCRDTDNEVIERLGDLAGLPPATRETHRFPQWQKSAGLAECYNYALAFANGKRPHHFLTFAGEPGTGKTHLAIAVAWHWLESAFGTVAYWQVETLLDTLRQGYAHDQADELTGTYATLNFAKKCSLLVLDDLGAERSTDWSSAKLDEVVDHRYLHRLPTVVTLNVTPDALPPRLADRLMEGKVFVLKAPSYRRRQRKDAP